MNQQMLSMLMAALAFFASVFALYLSQRAGKALEKAVEDRVRNSPEGIALLSLIQPLEKRINYLEEQLHDLEVQLNEERVYIKQLRRLLIASFEHIIVLRGKLALHRDDPGPMPDGLEAWLRRERSAGDDVAPHINLD